MRIRSIKPEFWRSDDITPLPIEDRLLFIGLWSYVDDNGVGRDKLADICADLFAHDLSVSPHGTLMRIDDGLKHLHASDLITRYSVDGRQFLYIQKWKAHQKINRPSPGRYPPPTSDDAVFTESSLSAHDIDSEASLPGAGEQGNRGTGEQGIKNSCSPAAPTSEYPDAFQDFWDEYPRKAGKRKALAAWQRACRRASESEILDGAVRYAHDPNRADQYTKYAEGWLGGDGWLDEPLPTRQDLRPALGEVSRADQKVQGWLDIGSRLTNQPKGIA
ncbi:hypothetical protein [Rhodococcus marinonascens]|uniref:hypothetical protein n=1 Tax=Rhodococcus marinonascens TaxID=38311 RepID=UPI000932EDCC|nr:hypothetical protein [Rhodococcus marinonascens]